MARIFRHTEFVIPDTPVRMNETDPGDNKFLEATLSGKAAFIVSGDKHLLELKSVEEVRMITAREFISILDREA